MTMISIDNITLDERCQPRATMNPEMISEYADAMTNGAEFPPLTVYRDGSKYILADGFHRLAAAKQVGKVHVPCDVQAGTIRDAILHAVGANATHGMRRTNADKRRAVETLLKDNEWSHWTDTRIAEACGVSSNFVGTMRRSLSSDESETPAERTYTDRYGNTRTMNTANIGRSRQAEDVDEDTGEILDDYPPYEVVEPGSPEAMFVPAPTPTTPTAPAPSAEQRSITLTYRDYGPEHRRLTARSLALELDAEFGDGFARMVGQEAS